MGILLQWIDIVWLAAAMAVLPKQHRTIAAGFFIGSMIMMRLLIELMGSIGYPNGLIGFMESDIAYRGLVVYSLSYLFYIIFLCMRPKTDKAIVMAGSISIFFMTALLFTFIMVL